MNINKALKALSNETRLQILYWLKAPGIHFSELLLQCDPDKQGLNLDEIGVCVGLIQHKAGLSQSTISHYLALLLDANLVKCYRKGQWTYYQRNEKGIAELLSVLKTNL